MTRREWARGAIAVATALLLVAACSSGGGGSASPTTAGPSTIAADARPPAAQPLPDADRAELDTAVGDGTCDPLDPHHCLLPFPSDHFTVVDRATDTDRRVHLPTGQLANAQGATLDPTEWNRNDGFSPGTPIMAELGPLDLGRSGAAPIGDIASSLDADSPTVLVDLTTGKRLAHWAELDQRAEEGEQALILRPAANLPEGHRIGVALRSLVRPDGTPVPAPVAFRAYRDNRSTSIGAFEARRPAMEQLFTGLGRAGVPRAPLQLAWSFTVASARSLAGPMLAMRDDALRRLGDGAPEFSVDEVVTTDLPPGIGRRVIGHLEVPLYLDDGGVSGSRLHRGPDGLPAYAGATWSANFTCQIPEGSLSAGGPRSRPVVYGHGLLGDASEAQGSQVAKIASTNSMLYCATDWIGMSESDLGTVAGILQDASKFPTMAERSLQGILDSLFLARAMRSPDGFSKDPSFHDTAGRSVIDTGEAYFDGNSQGSIMGGAATAVSTEWTKAVLGVPGMDYSLLLDRSSDFDQFAPLMRQAYPDRLDQLVVLGAMQMLWDRGESDGYAQHMTDRPYPGTPRHQVLLHVAFGDHQVSTWSAEVEARTIGARLRTPALAPGRHPDTHPYAGLATISSFPTDRSVLVYWDSGTLRPPSGNITPVMSEEYERVCGPLSPDEREQDTRCADSHEDPRRAPASIAQKDRFFRPDGTITDPCDGKPCTTPNRFTLDY